MKENLAHSSSFQETENLIQVSQDLSLARTLEEVTDITKKAARGLCGAEGATFILKENDLCYYVDEDAVGPLWKGRKFPLSTCISGLSIQYGRAYVIEDIYEDARVPHEAYRPTFVNSLVMVPIREKNPLGAIGIYWSRRYKASEEVVNLLRSLANLTAIALENVLLLSQLQKTNRILEESVRARDEFLSIASHELRTPLSSLKLQLQMLSRDVQSGSQSSLSAESLRAAADLSLRQVNNLGRLVENLLDVSRMQLHRIELRLSKFDFSDLVRDVVERLRAQLDGSGCRVTTHLEVGVLGEWDEGRIEQILTNLISNACKYAPGSPIRVSTRVWSGSVFLTVEDEGPGIRQENHSRIFERFEREANDTHVSGLGLGLFITKRLVEAHDGKIRLESEEGRGARFILEFPLRERTA